MLNQALTQEIKAVVHSERLPDRLPQLRMPRLRYVQGHVHLQAVLPLSFIEGRLGLASVAWRVRVNSILSLQPQTYTAVIQRLS